MLENIKINPEFERLIPPLTDDEFELLESNILSEGEIYTPIFVWSGYIIDGHHRFRILTEHKEIPYRVTEKHFDNKYEAMSWICNNQLGRRNLTPENKKYLIGKRYDAEKLAHGSIERIIGIKKEVFPSSQNGNLGKKVKTCERIAEETGTSKNYVLRADEFAKGVDAADEVVPGIKKDILSGKIKKPAKDISAIAKAPVEERKSLTENLRLTKVYDKPSGDLKQNIKSIAAEMRDVDTPITDESVLESLEGTIDMFIETCESTFVDHPNILLIEENYQKVLKILDKAKQYINKIKGEV